jgi:hypothetical protein
MTHTPDIVRPPREIIDALKDIGAATVAGTLGHMGIRNPHIMGPVTQNPGKSVVGPALTLQFMPKREDLYQVDEYAEPEKQLHRHVLDVRLRRRGLGLGRGVGGGVLGMPVDDRLGLGPESEKPFPERHLAVRNEIVAVHGRTSLVLSRSDMIVRCSRPRGSASVPKGRPARTA